ncbi:MAG: winged helix DNA-binding protein [Sphaerochaetaceae bacterium]|nr:winged helix DNA-binding protein [Sphaerochaetaceae bacterium]
MVLYDRYTKPLCEKFGLTHMELEVLAFLSTNPQYDTAADIVRLRSLAKSHVSIAQKTLCEKGLLEHTRIDGNRKSIHLRITEKATDIVEEIRRTQVNFGLKLFAGISPSDIELCGKVFDRICENADDIIINDKQF